MNSNWTWVKRSLDDWMFCTEKLCCYMQTGVVVTFSNQDVDI